MPRIAPSEHATILRLVEAEGCKVPDIAAQYGCTPANIYAILTRLRRTESPPPAPIAAPEPPPPAPLELCAPPPGRKPRRPRDVQKRRAAEPETPEPAPLLAAASARPVVPAPAVPTPPRPEPAPARAAPPPRGAAPKARLKSGYGLCTRSPEGDDTLTPFRSLEDLLSAVKPILRATANSPEPVWFSIQPVDLGSIDVETM